MTSVLINHLNSSTGVSFCKTFKALYLVILKGSQSLMRTFQMEGNLCDKRFVVDYDQRGLSLILYEVELHDICKPSNRILFSWHGNTETICFIVRDNLSATGAKIRGIEKSINISKVYQMWKNALHLVGFSTVWKDMYMKSLN